LKKLALQ
jgi:hypothetical protein